MSEKNEWKLAEALRESLLWTASSLAAVGKEQDVIVLEGRKRTIGEILDEANAALDTPSAPGDVQDERQAFEAWAKRKKMPLARIGQQYDDFWVDHAWNGWQARAALAAPAAGDALRDPALQKLFGEVITGALALGAQGVKPPPAGHWLTPFWDMARADATLAASDALALLNHPLLRDVLGYIEDAGPADVWGAAQSWMALRDAALAAQVPHQENGDA